MATINFQETLAGTAQTLREDGNVLSALTGLFIFLPVAILFWIILDAPQVRKATEQVDPEQVTLMMQERGLIMLPFLLLPVFGQLAIAAFLLDQSRPTAGQAMLRAAKLFLPFFATMMVVQIVLQLAAGLLMGLGLIGRMLLFAPAIYVSMRLFLLAPALAAPGGRLVAALRASWQMSGGKFWKVFMPLILGMMGAFFLGLIGLALLVMPARALFGVDVEIVVTALLFALLAAALILYALLFSVAAYRRLADGPAD